MALANQNNQLIQQFLTDYLYDSKGAPRSGVKYKQFMDGSEYRGYASKGKKNGPGLYKFLTGVVLMGQWSNDACVEGVMVMSDGERYEGQFKNGLKHGEGI